MRPQWKKDVNRVMNHWFVLLMATIITLYALFGDDIRLVFFTKEADFTFDNLTFIALSCLVVEITVNALT